MQLIVYLIIFIVFFLLAAVVLRIIRNGAKNREQARQNTEWPKNAHELLVKSQDAVAKCKNNLEEAQSRSLQNNSYHSLSISKNTVDRLYKVSDAQAKIALASEKLKKEEELYENS